MIIHGDSIEILKTFEANSIDALVTDPPYGLGDTSPRKVKECLQAWLNEEVYEANGKGFMSKDWDKWVPGPSLWKEVYRVLKPGAYGLVFSGSRTEDLMSISLRLAGFEIRDRLVWLYGSGFPKSHNIAKAIDKHYGLDGEIIGLGKNYGNTKNKQLMEIMQASGILQPPHQKTLENGRGGALPLSHPMNPLY